MWEEENNMKKVLIFSLLIIMLITPMLLTSALTTISAGTTTNFAILAGSTITNSGTTTVTGDIGLSPGTSFSGAGGVNITGTIHLTDAVALDAKNDLDTVYNQITGLLPVTRIASELGGQTLLPGVYDSADGTFSITGTLTLNAQGNDNAVFIFKAATTLVTASSSDVNLINSATQCQVFWQVGSSATLGTGSSIAGHIYADQSITATTGAEVRGQILARTGAVTLDGNIITNITCSNVSVDTSSSSSEETSSSSSTSTVTSTVNGGTLPDTAANLYQSLIIGISLVIVGITTLVISKHFTKEKIKK